MKHIKNKVKVLYFVDRMLRGGIQTFVIENTTHFNKDIIQIDYLLLDDGNDYELEETLRSLGSNVHKLDGVWLRKPTDYLTYCKSLNEFFAKHNDYNIVHMHSSSKNFMVLYYAKKYGINIRIAHSHSICFQSKTKVQILLGNILKLPLKKFATHYFACSEIAGKWMFGNKIVKNGEVKTIHNAVDVDKFAFNIDIREKMRNKLNLKNALVIGHVGRFTDLKNHIFLIDIFYEMYKQNENSKLILVGTGEKENEIKEKVNKLGLSNSVIFTGFKNNVSDYMQSMDVFLFPSKFEGLGLVLIEAQASGLPSFTSSNVVPMEAKVSELLNFISLENTPMVWSDKILKHNLERKDVKTNIRNIGYDIESSAKILEEFYINKISNI